MPGGYDGDIKLKVDLTPGDIKRTARVLQNNVKNVFDSTAGKALNQEFQKLQANIAKTSGRANQLSKQLDDLWENKKVPTKEYVEIQEQIDEAKTKLEGLNKQMQMAKDLGIDTKKSSAFKSLVEQAEELQNTIKYANGELEDLRDNNQAWQLDTSAQIRYQALLTQLNDVNNALTLQLRLLQESAQQSGYVDQTTGRFFRLRNVIQSVISAMRETWEFGPNFSTIIGQSVQIAKEKFDSLKQSILNVGPNIKSVFGSIQNTFSQIGNSALSGVSKILEGLEYPAQSLDHIFGFLASSAGQVVRAIGSLTATGAVNALSVLGNSAKRAALSLGGVLVNALQKVAYNAANVARQLAKIVTSKISGGIKNLTSHFNLLGGSAKRSVPSVKKIATTLLKYGLGVRSFYFLFRKIRSAISEGFTNLAEYSAPFKAVMDDFKSSLSNLKNSFAAAFAPVAEVVLPILTALIDKVNSAIEAIGKLIATLLGKKTYTKAVKGFNSVANSAGNATEQAKELEKTVAGFDDVEILGNKNSTANGNSSGGDGGVSGMFEEVPIDNEFSKLAEMIKDAWAKADFTEIGTMIGTKLKEALDSIPWDSVKDTMRKVAKSIATLLNGFLETPGLFDSIGRTIGEALNTALEGLNTFATNFHWDSLGFAISDGINAFFRTTDFKLAADTFSNWAKGVLETIYTTLESIDWRQIGQKLKEFITNVDWTGIVEGIARTIGAAIGGVAALIVEFFGDIPGKIKEYFDKKIEEKKAEFGDNGKAILLGILDGILDGIKSIGTWIKEHVLDPFITGFKNAFGIASPAKETTPIGKDILNGVLEGMLSVITGIGGWINKHILTPIKNAFGGFVVTIEVALQKAKQWASDIWEGIKAGAQTIVKTIKNKMQNLAGWKDEIFNFFTNGISTIEKTIQNKMANGGSWVSSIFNFFTNGIGTIIKTISHRMKIGDGWSSSIFNFFTNGISTISKVLSLSVSAQDDSSRNVISKVLGVSGLPLISAIIKAKAEVTEMEDKRGPNNRSLTTRGVVDTMVDNRPSTNRSLNSTGYINAYTDGLKTKPWFASDAYINNYYDNLRNKPWMYADAYMNQAYNYLYNKPWFYADAYMNQAYDYIPAWQKQINVVANMVSGFAVGAFRKLGGIFTPYGGWSDIPQYASGTTNATKNRPHGSMFIAGESGPELVGHINGRTEILNKSQIASAIYSAVKTAMLVGMSQLRSIIPVPMPISFDAESLNIPAIVQGQIVPYETKLTTMENVLNDVINDDPVTGTDLKAMLNDVITAVNRVQFYIGDEQIARHANIGNQKLDRRYNPVIQGG